MQYRHSSMLFRVMPFKQVLDAITELWSHLSHSNNSCHGRAADAFRAHVLLPILLFAVSGAGSSCVPRCCQAVAVLKLICCR